MNSQENQENSLPTLQEYIAEVGIDIEEFVNCLSDDQVQHFSDLIFRRESNRIEKKVTPLPDLAHDEFKVFDDKPAKKVTEKALEIRRRRYVAFVYYYSNFDRTDDQMIEFIRNVITPKQSYVQAARDLNKIKSVMNNQSRIRRELLRFQVIEMQKHAYQVAKSQGDAAGMTRASDGITKAAQLDKDITEIPWEEMVQPAFEPTSDLQALGEGFEEKTQSEIDAEIMKLRKRYLIFLHIIQSILFS